MNHDIQPNWWTRNFRWFMPLGCLTLVLFAAGAVAIFIALIFAGMKDGDVYRRAVAAAHASGRAAAALGSPMQEGFFVAGTERADFNAGQADLAIPISGSKANGTLYAVAIKSGGQWHYQSLRIAVAKSGEEIDLLQPNPAP